MQTRGHHPVRLRRRVQTRHNRPSVFVLDISPPQEGNCRVQTRGHHPVRLRRRVQTRHNRPSVFVLDISPPQEGNCRVQTRGHHPVRLRRRVQTHTIAPVYLYWTSPLHRRGIPPRQASPATSPQEGNCRVQTRGHHLVRLRRRVQTRHNRPSVFVLDISPPQEGNCRVQTRGNDSPVYLYDISPP